jgi:3-oxoacid CoA-transferase
LVRQSNIRPCVSRQRDVRCFSSSRLRWQEAGDQPVIDRTRSKLFKDADEAVADLKSGSTIFSAGFGLCGTAGMQSSVFNDTTCSSN